MRRFLEAQRIAPAYLPERLVLLDAMPMTATGKVQKFVLREQARALGHGNRDHPQAVPRSL
jgi:cyclohexanecarboxylate-CoA ligase